MSVVRDVGRGFIRSPIYSQSPLVLPLTDLEYALDSSVTITSPRKIHGWKNIF